MNKNNFIFILFIPAVLAYTCKYNQPEAPPAEPPVISVTKVEVMPLQQYIRASGVLASKTQSDLSFMSGGIIRKIHVSEGYMVRKGDLLAELDLTEISSRVKQAKLAYDKAKRDHSRVKALYADSVATLENLEDAKTALDLASAGLKIAGFNMDHSRITAPSDGKILKKIREVNEITAAGYPVFVFASTETDWILKVSLSDRDIVRINRTDSALIRFDAYPGKEFRAVVTEMSGAANLLSGTYDTELKLTDLPEKLVTGLVGSAEIYTATDHFMMIPYVSVAEASGNTAFVFVVNNDTAFRREIKIQAVTDEGIFVASGLSAGELIVTAGASWLKDRMPVNTVSGSFPNHL